ncbi:MAG: hypothetical protein ACTHOB_01785 [Ginsengibacter sp.]
MKKIIIAFFLMIAANICVAQQLNYFHITSSNTSFPDTGRMNGHLYDSVMYNTKDHYSDSDVLIITPKNFRAGAKADMIFWFHGWNNNIDSALVRYGLSRQFAESKINAVLVLSETAKHAPDSYGGKLEQSGTFSRLVNDVLKKLHEEKVVSRNCNVGHVILAGHSGAYRVMAGILQNGNVPVNEVILFDALYANTAQFLNWLKADAGHRFINLYTDHGGTLEETQSMLQQIRDLKLPVDTLEESSLTPQIISDNKILFIHSMHPHNDIIQQPDNFERFLDGNPFLEIIR